MVPAPIERSQLPGHRQRSQIPQHRQWSQRQPYWLWSRARARRRRFQRARRLDRPAPAGSAALRLLADVDISFSRNCCWQLERRTMALGRSAPLLTSASPGRGGGDGAGADRAQPATGSSPTIANSAALTVAQRQPYWLWSRARARRRRFQRARRLDRPAPAGSAALRLLADVDISFSRNCCWQLERRTMALGRSAPLLTSASPGRGGGDGAGADRAQPATGSSTTDRKICSTDRSCVNHTGCGHARARGGADSSALGG